MSCRMLSLNQDISTSQSICASRWGNTHGKQRVGINYLRNEIHYCAYPGIAGCYSVMSYLNLRNLPQVISHEHWYCFRSCWSPHTVGCPESEPSLGRFESCKEKPSFAAASRLIPSRRFSLQGKSVCTTSPTVLILYVTYIASIEFA